MLRKFLTSLPSLVVLSFLGLLYFSAASHAATLMTGGEDVSILDLVRPVFDALVSGHYALSVTLLIVLIVAASKKYLGDAIPFLHTDAGGSLLVFFGSGAAMAASLLAPGASFSLSLLWNAVVAGALAAGVYALVKNLLVDPFLKPLVAKSPAWVQSIFGLVMWIFEHATQTVTPPAIVAAEKSGAEAVTQTPAPGVVGIIGNPTELE